MVLGGDVEEVVVLVEAGDHVVHVEVDVFLVGFDEEAHGLVFEQDVQTCSLKNKCNEEDHYFFIVL